MAIAAKNCGSPASTWRHGRATTSVARTRVPRISHRFSRSFRDCPRLLLLVGEDEVLLDAALRVRDAATSAGTDARVLVGKGMQHDWPLTLPWLDESRLAWNAMRAFVEEHSR